VRLLAHSCYSCQYHLCVQCSAEMGGSGAITATVEVKQQNDQGANRGGGGGGGGGGYQCHQCQNKSIRLGKVGSRQNAVCFRCKQTFSGVQFTYWCSTCDLDCCEKCAEEISKEMMEKMNQFMKNPLNVMNIGFGSKKKDKKDTPQETTPQKPPATVSTGTPPSLPQKTPVTVSTGISGAPAEQVEEKKIENPQEKTMSAPLTTTDSTGTPTVSTGPLIGSTGSGAPAEPVEQKIDSSQGMTASTENPPLPKREKTSSTPGPSSTVSPAKPADKKTTMDKMNQGMAIAGAFGNMGATKAKGFLKDKKPKKK